MSVTPPFFAAMSDELLESYQQQMKVVIEQTCGVLASFRGAPVTRRQRLARWIDSHRPHVHVGPCEDHGLVDW